MKTLRFLLIPILFLCACNRNDLSRQEAAELISRQQNLPSTQTIVLGRYIKKSWSSPGSGFMPPVTVCVVEGGETYSDAQQRLADWQSKGLISTGETEEHSGACNYLWATTSLTDEGKKYLVKESDGVHEVKAYDLAFGEVTGIQINEQFKVAEADYTLKKTNITPFASNISPEPTNGKATFALFDDGWRIK